jgi:hypothetical protein
MALRNTKVITILNAIVCDSEADIETAKAITPDEAMYLAEALIYGSAHLRVLCASEAGTCPFTLTALEFSIDGTNYATLRTFDTAVDCTANGEKTLSGINGYGICADARTTSLRLVMGGSAPDGSNKITVTAQLVLQIPG